MNSINLTFLLYFTYISFVYTIKIKIDIKENSYKCMGEYLIENILTVFEINSETSKFQIEIDSLSDPNKSIYKSDINNTYKKIIYTPKSSDIYNFCIRNLESNKVIRFQIKLKTGVEAKDYSSIAKERNIRPVEENVSINYLLQTN